MINALLHDMIFMLVFMTKISVTMNSKQKCFYSHIKPIVYAKKMIELT